MNEALSSGDAKAIVEALGNTREHAHPNLGVRNRDCSSGPARNSL